MARAFRKAGGTATQVFKYYCPNCEEWRDKHDFTEAFGYNCNNYLGEHDGESYYNDYTSYTIWTCDNCSEIVSVDQQPDSRAFDASVWVCGECKDEYEDLDEATDCCQ